MATQKCLHRKKKQAALALGSRDPDNANNSAPAGENEDHSQNASKRRPSATVAFILMTQLQFLATLSLVDATVAEDAWLSDFLLGLR